MNREKIVKNNAILLSVKIQLKKNQFCDTNRIFKFDEKRVLKLFKSTKTVSFLIFPSIASDSEHWINY